MKQILLAEDGPAAMARAGALLDNEGLNVQVVTDGRSLLDRLNEAPNFFHAVVMSYDLPEIGGAECLTFIRQFHGRVRVLVLSESVEADRLAELAGLGVRKRYVLDRGADAKAFADWVGLNTDDVGEE